MPDFKSEMLAKGRSKKRVPNVPVGEEYGKMEDDGDRYLVQVESLGGHRMGKVIGRHDLQPGAQVQRLLDDGHLARLSDDEADQLLEDPSSRPESQPYPIAPVAPPKPEIRHPAPFGVDNGEESPGPIVADVNPSKEPAKPAEKSAEKPAEKK